jgi:23S rRNA G2445 N2-methylase RlmL
VERDVESRSGAATEWASPDEPLRYYASCASGLEGVLARELQGSRVRASRVRVGSRGVQFDGDDATGYRALLWTRTANKVAATKRHTRKTK